MYVCKHCGFVSHNDNINYCNNIKCRFYGCNEDGCNGRRDYKENRCDSRKNCRDNRCDCMGNEPYRNAMSFLKPETRAVNAMPKGASSMPNTAKYDMPNTAKYDMPNTAKYEPMPHHISSIPVPPMNQHMKNEDLPSDTNALGFATVPFQHFNTMLPVNELFETGTVFPELFMPYTEKIIRRG